MMAPFHVLHTTLGVGDTFHHLNPKVQVTTKTWDPIISSIVTTCEVYEAQWIIWNFTKCFAFSSGQLRGQEVWIILEDDNPIFRQPYRLSEVERTLV